LGYDRPFAIVAVQIDGCREDRFGRRNGVSPNHPAPCPLWVIASFRASGWNVRYYFTSVASRRNEQRAFRLSQDDD
jgi:hypothetical protein